jgi:hypothetical protein
MMKQLVGVPSAAVGLATIAAAGSLSACENSTTSPNPVTAQDASTSTMDGSASPATREAPSATTRVHGQTSYTSAPAPGSGNRGGTTFNNGGAATNNAAANNGGAVTNSAAAPSGGSNSWGSSTNGSASGSQPRTVQETDIYRVDGTRLYYLNSYRGLMVFDISNVDAPKLVGRSPIFGDPQEMFIQNGVAVVVVGDWYGINLDGSPFYGSIARGLDCNDPTNIKDVGDAYLRGWVQDTRVVGSVLYTVAEDDGWEYGWYYGGTAGSSPVPTVSIASISFANGAISKVAEQTFNGYSPIFNVTQSAILFASAHVTDPNNPWGSQQGTDLRYVDVSDPGGAIRTRGTLTIDSSVNGWGPDNGRWNIDFADGVHAHAVGCASNSYCGGSSDAYALTTIDFSNPDAPQIASELPITNLGWSAAARFDVDPAGSYAHLYLSPSGYYYGNGSANETPLYIYDLSQPAAPQLVGQTSLDGYIWLFMPQGKQLFALGNSSSSPSNEGQAVEVQYVDVTNPAAPKNLGQVQFGSGWAWSPAAETFKAFIVNPQLGLAVIPFSGWDYNGQTYNNGLELVQFNGSALTGSGTAHTKGWVQRGIFVGSRLFSLSDESLGVVDYSNPSSPRVVTELTLARNVVNAQPQGPTIAELSSDWWGNDTTTSEMRVLPIWDAAETTDDGHAVSATIKGVDAQVFQNGTLAYVVTDVQVPVPCGSQYGGPTGTNGQCTAYTQQVQVVDTANGGVKLRGSITLPPIPQYGGWGWGWDGYYYYDWYNGSNVVQVDGDALAFRRWYPYYSNGPNGPVYDEDLDALFVVDIANPDAPSIASLTIQNDPTAWWGNLQAVGNTLYATDYQWVDVPAAGDSGQTVSYTTYWLEQIDLSDRAHPRIGQHVNVPGVFVGASSSNPSTLYFADYRWDGNDEHDGLAACELTGGLCYFQSETELDGYVGNIFVQNDRAYTTVEEYDWMWQNGQVNQPPYTELHQVDLSNPAAPVDRVATTATLGWGWLLGLAGDRAVVTSGWGSMGVDIYQLSDTAAPKYRESVRTLGWEADSLNRQGNTLYVASGYWGVQPIALQ